MDIIHSLKAKAACALDKQDALANKLCSLADRYIEGDQEATIEYYKAEELYKKYGEAYHRTLLVILQLEGMKYALEDMGDALQLN